MFFRRNLSVQRMIFFELKDGIERFKIEVIEVYI